MEDMGLVKKPREKGATKQREGGGSSPVDSRTARAHNRGGGQRGRPEVSSPETSWPPLRKTRRPLPA